MYSSNLVAADPDAVALPAVAADAEDALADAIRDVATAGVAVDGVVELLAAASGVEDELAVACGADATTAGAGVAVGDAVALPAAVSGAEDELADAGAAGATAAAAGETVGDVVARGVSRFSPPRPLVAPATAADAPAASSMASTDPVRAAALMASSWDNAAAGSVECATDGCWPDPVPFILRLEGAAADAAEG